MIAKGGTSASKIYLGSTEVSKMYKGDTLVYGGESPSYDLPEGYTRVSYIKSNGGYIDTGQVVRVGDVVEMGIWVTSAMVNTIYYGWRRDGTSNDDYQMYGGVLYSYENALYSYFYMSAGSAPYYNLFDLDRRVNLRLITGNTSYLYADNVQVASHEGTEPFDSNGSSVYAPCIFTFNALGTPNTSVIAEESRLYEYKHTRNGVPVAWFIPCFRDADNVRGVYDVVNNTFLTSPNNVAFTCDLDDVTSLYPVTAYRGKVGSHRYSSSSDGHFGMYVYSTGAKYIWLQDSGSNNTSLDADNLNRATRLFSISAGDTVVFKVKNISRVGTGTIALNVRTTDGGNIGVSTGNFSNTTDKTISITASASYDVSGVYMYWANGRNRALCLDVELWVNGVRYI